MSLFNVNGRLHCGRTSLHVPSPSRCRRRRYLSAFTRALLRVTVRVVGVVQSSKSRFLQEIYIILTCSYFRREDTRASDSVHDLHERKGGSNRERARAPHRHTAHRVMIVMIADRDRRSEPSERSEQAKRLAKQRAATRSGKSKRLSAAYRPLIITSLRLAYLGLPPAACLDCVPKFNSNIILFLLVIKC